ncbi:MAG TPA: helix-turn-helix domain-containing protein [Gemmatimonadaceae bacterium]|nr:helix-turn-helix domain-containing protein [Gemmatimonadaceae bacterium]
MSEEIRNRILDAAARVYAQYGFRGATTRRIASEADVNEVTLFRTFGSKAELLEAMLQSQVVGNGVPLLTFDEELSARDNLVQWCSQVLDHLRQHAHLIRKTIGEAEERPDAACAACERSSSAGASLVVYLERLREDGYAEPDTDLETGVSMLMSTMFGDALYRDIMPNAFPPIDVAAERYAETFMRAVGVRAAPMPVRSRPSRVAGTRRRDH